MKETLVAKCHCSHLIQALKTPDIHKSMIKS